MHRHWEVQKYFPNDHQAHGCLLEKDCVMLQGQHVSAEQEHSTEMWLAEHHPEFLPGIMAFKISDPDYYTVSIMHTDDVQ
ncbi:hypothetical protein PR048_028020, partial [Dryococelus australis]